MLYNKPHQTRLIITILRCRSRSVRGPVLFYHLKKMIDTNYVSRHWTNLAGFCQKVTDRSVATLLRILTFQVITISNA